MRSWPAPWLPDRVVEQHLESGLGGDLGDPGAHRPRAQHADVRTSLIGRGTGSRFSLKAATPSAWSSVRPARSWSAASASRLSVSGRPRRRSPAAW